MTTRNMNSGKTKTSVSRDNKVVTEIEAATDTEIAAATATAIATATTTATINTTRTTKTTTKITSDPGILCFHHCNVKVFCFTLPHICPQCKMALATHPNGDANSAGGITGSGGNRHKKKKNITKSYHNTNADQSLSINTKRDDNDANNVIGENNVTDAAAAAASDVLNDGENDDDDDDDEDDVDNRNGFNSNIMASRLLPFRLPYPFVRANQYPCAIVLRPTTGDFLNDYNNTTDLHIAVTTSTGCVVEFDRHGLRRHRTGNMSEWWQCLLVGDVPEPWYDYWDQVLFKICQQPDKWTVSHYHEDKHNCYTFVLNFLQALTYDKLSEAASSKTRFCEKYIVPRTTTAGKYISLYRKLRDAGIYVHHTNHQKVRYAKQEQQLQLKQRNPNKSNNLTETTIAVTAATAATTTMHMLAKNSLVTNKQQQQQQQQQQHHQQHLSNHHNHHSIILRPHSTLCTIEE